MIGIPTRDSRAGHVDREVAQPEVSGTQSRKRQAFLRLGEKRTNAVLERLRILSNCANPYVYEYDEADVRRIFSAIDEEVRLARLRFQGPKRARKFTLHSGDIRNA
jgi:hypothetical protein